MTEGVGMWFWFALGSAVFAALTSIPAKIGYDNIEISAALFKYGQPVLGD